MDLEAKKGFEEKLLDLENMNSQQIIEMRKVFVCLRVFDRPALWDSMHKDYKKRGITDALWYQVSNEHNMKFSMARWNSELFL